MGVCRHLRLFEFNLLFTPVRVPFVPCQLATASVLLEHTINAIGPISGTDQEAADALAKYPPSVRTTIDGMHGNYRASR